MGYDSQVLSGEFEDFDAYAESLQDAEVRITLPKLHKAEWSIGNVVLPNGMHLQSGMEGSGSIAQCENASEGCNLFLNGNNAYLLNGVHMPMDSAFLLMPGSEFFLCAPEQNTWASIFVPEELMGATGLEEDRAGRRRKRSRIIGSASPNGRSLFSAVTRFVAAVVTDRAVAESPAALEGFQDELVTTLSEGYGHVSDAKASNRGRPLVTDKIMVARAIDAIEGSADGKLPMKDLLQVVGVSERSLRAAFSRYIGVSPTSYMQLRVLNKARERLTKARPDDTTVTEVAADLGLWDTGRFAARYKAAFRELPSETLRKESN